MRFLAAAFISLILLLGIAPPASAATEYKVVYLAWEPYHVDAAKEEPLVMEDGLLISEAKTMHPPKGCKPMTECRGTWELKVLSDMLNTLSRRGWRLISVQPVLAGELKGGYLAFLAREPVGAPPQLGR